MLRGLALAAAAALAVVPVALAARRPPPPQYDVTFFLHGTYSAKATFADCHPENNETCEVGPAHAAYKFDYIIWYRGDRNVILAHSPFASAPKSMFGTIDAAGQDVWSEEGQVKTNTCDTTLTVQPASHGGVLSWRGRSPLILRFTLPTEYALPAKPCTSLKVGNWSPLQVVQEVKVNPRSLPRSGHITIRFEAQPAQLPKADCTAAMQQETSGTAACRQQASWHGTVVITRSS